ncbi:hypothetical protein [Candidatus Nitrosotenuis uzonensis]|uniref:Uncharacterized protein n=1 Tax=Candidatus Nitrosotenuis uzonensis TaxID=1407055 RepID=A0A812EXM2_9ARCH|nr:hypothetical protein [Candidatus Nitrosotenuis uzonensis]MCA2003297.1 hypothetical protein [Candidatus Nitrosotenuis sp.]CAE6497341.1 conserved hypothetical protein [Candidatus Nitrosotenuis uzonensis]
MEHILYSDGNSKRISWLIKTADSIKKQFREQADIYRDKVTVLQSKYIALHVGIFWSIGVFIIKNQDTVRVKLDSSEMLNHLAEKETTADEFAKKRKLFIDQLARQRNLNLIYEKIDPSENFASSLLSER